MIEKISFLVSGKIVQPILYYGLNRYKKLHWAEFYRFREWKALDENLLIQRQLLAETLRTSVSEVPYYQKIYLDLGRPEINPENAVEVLKKFPILDKSILRNNHNDLKNPYVNSFIKNTSGGSTGEPVIFLQSDDYIDHAPTLYTDGLAGFTLGFKTIYLWGSENEILQISSGLRRKIGNILLRRTYLNTFLVKATDMDRFIQIINKAKPDIIIAYVQSAYDLAQHIKRNNLKIYSPKSIILSAGTLFPDHRNLIEEVFLTKTYNRYGSREVGHIAMECDHQAGLHLTIFNNYIEILDSTGKDVQAGQEGEVIVTQFHNRVMPLIRYRIGDRAVKQEKSCVCGRGIPVIGHVTGRTVNIFTTRNGSKVDGEYFTHLFYFVENVQKFQVIQETYERIIINIQTLNHKPLQPSVEQDITRKIKKVMGENCMVIFKYYDELYPTKSGKFLYTISLVSDGYNNT